MYQEATHGNQTNKGSKNHYTPSNATNHNNILLPTNHPPNHPIYDNHNSNPNILLFNITGGEKMKKTCTVEIDKVPQDMVKIMLDKIFEKELKGNRLIDLYLTESSNNTAYNRTYNIFAHYEVRLDIRGEEK